MKTLENSDSDSAPAFEKPILSEKEQKNEINRNYLPNLSEYQQIFFDIKNENGEEETLYPNVNIKMNQRKDFIYFIIII